MNKVGRDFDLKPALIRQAELNSNSRTRHLRIHFEGADHQGRIAPGEKFLKVGFPVAIRIRQKVAIG